MKKWLFGFLGVTLIVFCSVFGYVSYQKHEGEVFKQNIEKKMPVDQINAHAKSYKEDATNVNNDMSLGQMLSIQKEAIEMGVNKQVFAQIQIPALGLALPIFKGANQYTLSLGAATYFYYKGYKNHEHEFVPEVKKDWNDQLKHEIQQQEIRKQKRAMLFQQGRQQERE
ncbi:hypothetical protein EGW23_10915 [Enterococcus faecium]|nr:hypothetical protein EGW23_10915 [Enterococcus faecium]ROW87190.1 hypothetical protein EGW12_10810 [Enterococcus faecium]ROX37176.1 hypothetical protein EGW40_10800 [Enterococcus faecium]ROX84826.1 hypothetical protein EGW45_10805 [Enterococcus faecium]